MNPKEIVELWVNSFNQGDPKTIAELYHEDAVNHQVANEPIEGKENIQSMFKGEFESADMHCIIENIFEDGDWAILEWRDPTGLRGADFSI